MFEIGKTYTCKSICNSACVWAFKVLARTDKTVTIADEDGKTKRCKINNMNGEFVYPLGKYSMCPVLRA